MNKFINPITSVVVVIMLAMIVILTLMGCTNDDDSSQLTSTLPNSENRAAVMKSVTLDDLKRLPVAEPPILSAQEAISYSVNLDSFRSSLENIVRNADFVTWNVTSQLKTAEGSSWWEVEVKSSKMLPSVTCAVSFTDSGKLVSYDSCEYNK